MTAGASPWERGNLPSPPVPVADSFEGFLGLEWLAFDEASARVRFPVRAALRQPLGLLHGGIYSAVAETVASVVTAHAVAPNHQTASGMNNCANFLRPITQGTLEVVARRVSAEPGEWVWTHDFSDASGRLCAVVTVTVAVRAR